VVNEWQTTFGVDWVFHAIFEKSTGGIRPGANLSIFPFAGILGRALDAYLIANRLLWCSVGAESVLFTVVTLSARVLVTDRLLNPLGEETNQLPHRLAGTHHSPSASH
jgi:hypothetical protein